jgi:hypothetical protein
MMHGPKRLITVLWWRIFIFPGSRLHIDLAGNAGNVERKWWI